jgi:hypothetical protein
MSLRQAHGSRPIFNHIEGREVRVMSRRDWQQVSRLREGDIAEIDLSPTPITDVARDSRIEDAVMVRKSPVELVVEVSRYDPNDMRKPINRDRYRVRERIPLHRNFAAMVNAASTEDNATMWGSLDHHVFFR